MLKYILVILVPPFYLSLEFMRFFPEVSPFQLMILLGLIEMIMIYKKWYIKHWSSIILLNSVTNSGYMIYVLVGLGWDLSV
ncbi:hypothetical protein [Pseudalkalibacillus berkeleyi]|uniref:Uncharacterized protein n=1 Tax=Pseudalkalibacillus berkeleyi TaxID=1069813 RepID=A0ABS9H4G8_9BACL|nr:hypothetical protein [Pseudalkalibacillus berkeleyi]MCF6138855.1 hypothetical protein [Pseudalkalibacillus berkeleyi]